MWKEVPRSALVLLIGSFMMPLSSYPHEVNLSPLRAYFRQREVGFDSCAAFSERKGVPRFLFPQKPRRDRESPLPPLAAAFSERKREHRLLFPQKPRRERESLLPPLASTTSVSLHSRLNMENHLIVRQGRDFGDLALWMKSVLVAENLWGTIDPSVKDNESSYGLQEKEEKALQVIHNYCSGRALFAIAKEKKPKCAWKKLAEFYYKEAFDAPDEELKYVGMEQLTEAVERKNWEFVEKLLAYWPDLTISMEQHLQVSFLKLLSSRDWENAQRVLTWYPPLKTSLEETFGEFVRGGDWEAIENSVIRHPHLGTIKVTSRDETALHVAVHGGKERIVNCLVEQMEDLKGVDLDGFQP